MLTRIEKKSLKDNRPINFIYGEKLPNGEPNPKRLLIDYIEALGKTYISYGQAGQGQYFKDALIEATRTIRDTASPEAKALRAATDDEKYPILDQDIQNILSAPKGAQKSAPPPAKPEPVKQPQAAPPACGFYG